MYDIIDIYKIFLFIMMKGRGNVLKHVYFLVLIIASLLMLICGIFTGKKGNSGLINSIRKLTISAAITSATYAAAIVMPYESWARFFYGMYFAMSDFLLIAFLHYIKVYSKMDLKEKWSNYIFCIVAVADLIMMLINNFKENVFLCSPVVDSLGHTVYEISSITNLYMIHRTFAFSLMIFSIVILLNKIFTVPSIYRKKYAVIFAIFLISVSLDIISFTMRVPIDMSLGAYIIILAGVYYFSIIYIPHNLVEQLLSLAVENMNDAVFCFDAYKNCIYKNEVTRKLFTEKKDIDNLIEYYENCINDEALINGDSLIRREEYILNDECRNYLIVCKKLNDKNNNFIGCFMVVHDETEEIRLIESERFYMTHDKLTKLYNKDYFYLKVRALLDEEENDKYYMICTDVKDFKLVNDVFGVDKGDDLLMKIAAMLRGIANCTDGIVYGRMSCDRFAICIPKENYNEEFLEQEVRKLGEVTKNKSYHIYIHVGVYPIVDKTMDISVMCDRAYMTINSIKDSYTEAIAYYDEKLRESRLHEKRITGEFNEAIRKGQFCMFLQPQIDSYGNVRGAEALVRWFHPERGIIPPLKFIGIFEKSGLIGNLDHHIWELACMQLKKWKDSGRENYHISVNISPRDFYFMDIYEIFTGLIEKYDILPGNLKLEITETAVMTDSKNNLKLIDRLREYGFSVEIDDFGSGYSSLNMLKEINADVLKVDMGFLEKTNNPDRSRAILSTIIALSKQLGMEVVTEGVETEEQLEFLRDAGCDIFQGYLFDSPMMISDFEEKYFA